MASGRTSQWAWDAALPGCRVSAGTGSAPGRASGTLQPRNPGHSGTGTPPLPRVPICAGRTARTAAVPTGRSGPVSCSPGTAAAVGTPVCQCHPRGEPPLRTEDHGHITAPCPGHPQPLGTCGGAVSRGDTFGGLCWSHPERSLASPRVGLQQKPLFGLEMAFSVSRAAQGANSTAEQIDGYSGRRNGNFLDEVCGGWERSLVPVTMWRSTVSTRQWHSSSWALLPLGCSWLCGHFGIRGTSCENMRVSAAA